MGKDRREIIRNITKDYLYKNPGNPGRQKLRELASMIVGQYPASFKLTELFANRPFAKGDSETLFRQLEHRIQNLRRPPSSLKWWAQGENPIKKTPRNSVWIVRKSVWMCGVGCNHYAECVTRMRWLEMCLSNPGSSGGCAITYCCLEWVRIYLWNWRLAIQFVTYWGF